MARGDGFRPARVAEQVRAELARALDREIADPRLRDVVVSRVQVSGDLQVAWVYVRITTGDAPDARKRAMQGLRSASGRLRKAVSSSLELRRTPELRFSVDEAVDEQARVLELLGELDGSQGDKGD
jgi:ribosome-binding factor A